MFELEKFQMKKQTLIPAPPGWWLYDVCKKMMLTLAGQKPFCAGDMAEELTRRQRPVIGWRYAITTDELVYKEHAAFPVAPGFDEYARTPAPPDSDSPLLDWHGYLCQQPLVGVEPSGDELMYPFSPATGWVGGPCTFAEVLDYYHKKAEHKENYIGMWEGRS